MAEEEEQQEYEDKNKGLRMREQALGQKWSKMYEKTKTNSIHPCCSKTKLHEKHPK